MQAVGRLGSYITQGVYTVSGPFHPFGGAVDIVVVEQQDGTFKSSPWYVRFGKFQGVLKAKEKEKIVDISVNGIEASFHMYLDQKGEAFFLRDVNAEEGESVFYPSSSGNDTYDDRPLKSKSCNFDSGASNSIGQIDIDDGKVMARTNSRRARILGLVLGRRSLKGGVEDDDMNRADSLERAEIAANLLELKWSTNLVSPRKDSEKTLGSSSRADNVESDLHQRKLEDEACSSTEQHGISSNSAFELGQEKGVINLSTRIDIAEERERDPNVKEVIYDIGSTSSDLQVEHVELEAGLEKQLNGEEVSGINTVNILGNNISDEDISASGVQSPVKCETSESSKVDMDCSIEQTHDVLHLPSGGGGEVRVHTEVLHGTTVLLPEGTETEEITKNVDLGMPVTEVSEVHSRQTYCSDSDVSMYDVVDVEDIPTLPKSQTVNTCLGHCSAEKVESNYVTKTSNCNNLDDQALDDNNIKDKDVFSTLSSLFESFDDCPPRKSTRRSPSASSDGEFLFSDLDESRINDQFEGSISPEYVDKECHISSEIGAEKEDQLSCANCNLHSSLENSTTENQMSDLEKLRGISSPIAIPRYEAAVEEVGQCTESLPNLSSGINILGQDDVRYPLSQSLDSKSTCLQWTFPGDDDVTCLKSDNDKEYKLPHEEPGAKDDHSSAEFESTALKLPIGDPSTQTPSPRRNWRIWPFSLRRSESQKAMIPASIDVKNTSFDNSSKSMISTDANKNELIPNLMQNKVRANTPTSEQLASLNLKEGGNIVAFTFSTAMLGKQQVDARIYLWKWNARIVISDVDGTITRSDVLGQFMPLVGIDWSQTGVAHLFSAIKENGYQLLFLSARSISQAYITRQFLLNLKQDGKVLPDGPVVISPDGLFPSLYREVIRRAPHEFKIACLEDIKALFPSDCNPFYAGFGNRDTDEISYLKVGIPKGKIFIINPRGEIVVNRSVDTKSYTSLHALVNGMFPPTKSSEQEDFNSWNFWKLPPPGIDI